jgi:hypothetical protein
VSPFRSHYVLDRMGRRVLFGLSFEETAEFETLDVRIPYDQKPCNSSGPMVSLGPVESRWLELYRKHRAAFDARQEC